MHTYSFDVVWLKVSTSVFTQYTIEPLRAQADDVIKIIATDAFAFLPPKTSHEGDRVERVSGFVQSVLLLLDFDSSELTIFHSEPFILN